MKKALDISYWALGIALLFISMGFGIKGSQNLKWSQTGIAIERATEAPLVTEDDVWKVVEKYYLMEDSLALSEINIGLLEEKLENQFSIASAEVYWSLMGTLNCKLQQEQPLARVSTSDSSFYLLENGVAMPLSPHYSMAVPIVSGALNDSSLQEIAAFWQHVQQHEFFGEFFEGLEQTEDGHWLLYPQPGHHRVRMGTPRDWLEKLNRLEVFYKRVVTPEYLDSLKSIDLRYQDQVICRKK